MTNATLGAVLIILVATTSSVMVVVVIIVVVVCRRRLRVRTDPVSAVNVSASCTHHDDVERLLPSDELLRRPPESVDDDDDDELHRGRCVSISNRLDPGATRRSVNSRRCLVETDEVDSEGSSFFVQHYPICTVLSSATLFRLFSP